MIYVDTNEWLDLAIHLPLRALSGRSFFPGRSKNIALVKHDARHEYNVAGAD